MAATIGLVLGDRNGIGPEITAGALASAQPGSKRFVLIGDGRVFERARRLVGMTVEPRSIDSIAKIDDFKDERLFIIDRSRDIAYAPGPLANASAGAEVLDNLSFASRLAASGKLNGLVFAPLNKQSMKLAGLSSEDELDFIADAMGGSNSHRGELNVVNQIWAARVTSHVPISSVASLITKEAVERAAILLYDTMCEAGFVKPRIAVSGLNPHAGDGGIYGTEEIDKIEPAVASIRARGVEVSGPHSPDSLFPFLDKIGADGVVSMYHDQGQIATKLLGKSDGVTVLAGLPIPVTTPAHGTAFDIAWMGKARLNSMQNAITLCQRMAKE